jgi:hypothetical protein
MLALIHQEFPSGSSVPLTTSLTEGVEGNRDVGHSDFPKKARKTPPNPPVLDPVAKRESDFARNLFVGGVAELRFPIEVMDCHAAAWSEHTGHFGKGLFGIGDVHEHSLGADGIEGVVQKTEHLRVANLKGYRKVSADGAANGLSDQRFTDVNPSDVTAKSNSLSKIKASVPAPQPISRT